MTRIYSRSFRAEDADGHPIGAAQVTLWDSETGGTQLVSGITDMAGNPIAGGILVSDSWGYVPDFQDTLDRPDIWAIGSLTGSILGVGRVLLESSSDDTRITALETFTQGPGSLDSRLTAVETSRGQANGIATLDAGGKVPSSQLAIATSTPAGVNVIDYGATGNGVTDDSAAIQAAINAATAGAGGGRCVVPPGTYLIAAELEATGSLWLDLTPGATIKRGSASMQYMIRNFNSTYAPTGYTGRGRIRISGGVWDAAGDTLTGSVTAIIFAHAQRIRVESVTVRNVRDWHAIELNSTQDATVRDCTFEGFNAVAAGRTISEAVQLDLALDSSTLPGIGAGAYDNTPCDDILVTGCRARSFGTLGSYGRLTGSHSAANNVFHRKVRVIGNHGEKLNDYLVRGYNWIDATISGNTCTDSNGGVRFEVPASMTVESESVVISGNTFRNLGVQNNGTAVLASAISVAGLTGASNVPVREMTVTGNVIKTSANTNGIEATNVADVVITGNVVKNLTAAASVGVNVGGSANAVVTGNKIDTVVTGIWVRDVSPANSQGTVVTGNHLNTCTGAGMQIDSPGVEISSCRLRTCGSSTKGSIELNAANDMIVSCYIWKAGGSGTVAVNITSASTDAYVTSIYFRGWASAQTGTVTDTGTTSTINNNKFITTA